MPATFNVKVCDEKYFSGNFYSAEAAAFNFIAAVGRKLSCGIVRADVETEVVTKIKISHTNLASSLDNTVIHLIKVNKLNDISKTKHTHQTPQSFLPQIS